MHDCDVHLTKINFAEPKISWPTTEQKHRGDSGLNKSFLLISCLVMQQSQLNPASWAQIQQTRGLTVMNSMFPQRGVTTMGYTSGNTHFWNYHANRVSQIYWFSFLSNLSSSSFQKLFGIRSILSGNVWVLVHGFCSSKLKLLLRKQTSGWPLAHF